MSLLTAIQNVGRKAGYSVDAEVLASNDVTTRQLAAWAQDVIKTMAHRYEWPRLWKSYSITTDGTATYALPGDFSHYHFDTFWNESDGWRVLGPMSPEEYAGYRGSQFEPLSDRFAIRGVTDKEIFIYPTPGTGDIIVFEYQSARGVRPVTWTATTAYAAGDYCFYNGNYYSTSSSGTSGSTAPTHTTGSASDGGVTWAYYSGAYEDFLFDDDEPVLYPQVFEQGVFERFAEIKGLSFAPRFDAMLEEEYRRVMPGKTLYMGGANEETQIAALNGRITIGRP